MWLEVACASYFFAAYAAYYFCRKRKGASRWFIFFVGCVSFLTALVLLRFIVSPGMM